MFSTKKLIPWLLCAPFMGACSDSSDNSENSTLAAAAVPFQELYDQGVDRYLGAFSPMSSQRLEGGVTQHNFGGGDGPLCFTGNEFNMSTRPGPNDELMIFLQGGGACGPTSCSAVDVGLPLFNVGILSSDDPTNPASSADLAYIPYCDGTLFTGDRDVDSDGDGRDDRFFRGVQNLSAALDVIANTFPAPSRIILAGNSAGGAGSHYALPLVRKLYPDTPINLINDSGPSVSQPGTQNALLDYWNSAAFLPASCSTCIGDDGNLTDYYKYQLLEDTNLRIGYIGSTGDEVLVGRTGVDGTAFRTQLIGAVTELEADQPERFRSLISETQEHTFIIKQFDFPIGGTTVRLWVTDMLNNPDSWISKRD
ncbi:MAG: pectin acetylesterase-family hydrolase [Pseudomonadota bacterium]